ncbi:MAG: hypothetical protein HQM15_02085 [Deltaproteobacteria bacterium]|nr:hypothetical protein [Deltaproteobacteria bacterium]
MPIYRQDPRPRKKQPDEFVSLVDKLVIYARERSAVVLFTAAVILFVACSTWFWRFYHSNQEQQLASQIFEVKKKTPGEQKQLYSDLVKKYRYAPLGIWMSLQLADLQSNDCDEVIKTLSDYVGHGESSPLRGLTYLKMGACLENKQDWGKAIEIYERAYSDSTNPLKDMARLRQAYVLKAQSKKEEAKKVFEELSQESAIVLPVVREEAGLALLSYSLSGNDSAQSQKAN